MKQFVIMHPDLDCYLNERTKDVCRYRWTKKLKNAKVFTEREWKKEKKNWFENGDGLLKREINIEIII